MSLTPPERETVIVVNDEDAMAEIYSAQRKWITKLRKNPAARLVSEDRDGCWFEVPANLISVRAKSRAGQGPSRTLSADQIAAMQAGKKAAQNG